MISELGEFNIGLGAHWAESQFLLGWESIWLRAIICLCYSRHDDVMCGILGIYSLSLELTVVDLLFFRD